MAVSHPEIDVDRVIEQIKSANEQHFDAFQMAVHNSQKSEQELSASRTEIKLLKGLLDQKLDVIRLLERQLQDAAQGLSASQKKIHNLEVIGSSLAAEKVRLEVSLGDAKTDIANKTASLSENKIECGAQKIRNAELAAHASSLKNENDKLKVRRSAQMMCYPP